jgi:ArsR family transcriptional regulator, arsenate/arsenite/antimonite-responsive transcriptional repressor / arsenate reductase (thioredoxin)
MNTVTPGTAPEFLKLLANDVRWQILGALAHSDLRVQELVAVATRPINLVSYHLKLLRNQDIVHERRSSADGRDVYYALDLARLEKLYGRSGALLHPALGPTSRMAQRRHAEKPLRVLFLCTQNRARSQMAEGLLRHLGEGRVEVESAGVRPGIVSPLAVLALDELGIDISGQRSKHLDGMRDRSFDRVITVCDQVREHCPTFPGNPDCVHWSIADPIAAAESVEGEDTRRAIFAATAQQLATRVRFLLVAESS